MWCGVDGEATELPVIYGPFGGASLKRGAAAAAACASGCTQVLAPLHATSLIGVQVHRATTDHPSNSLTLAHLDHSHGFQQTQTESPPHFIYICVWIKSWPGRIQHWSNDDPKLKQNQDYTPTFSGLLRVVAVECEWVDGEVVAGI